jgi:preprotein translocase subunit SecE
MADATVARAGFAERVRGFYVATKRFFAEVRDEMRKVTWPTADETRSRTIAILIFVLIVSAIIFVMDWSVRGIINIIVNVFGG